MRLGLCAAIATLVFPATAAAYHDGGPGLVLRWPAAGTITSPFGRDGYRWHPGLDIGILRSLDVSAAAPGRVAKVGYVPGYEGYGSVVLVDLGEGFSALYAHLAEPLARPGSWIWTGDPIGIAGCTGWCTGTHLHFELRYRGRAFDPLPLIAAE